MVFIIPCKSTVAMVVNELGVISDPQVGEVMSMNHNITLSWDSTLVDGQHINEIPICISLNDPSVCLACN